MWKTVGLLYTRVLFAWFHYDFLLSVILAEIEIFLRKYELADGVLEVIIWNESILIMIKLLVDFFKVFFACFDTPVVKEMLQFIGRDLAIFLNI